MDEWYSSYSKKELCDCIESMARQFAYQDVVDNKACLTTGGLSALERAFGVLGWGDPHPVPEDECQHPGCHERDYCEIDPNTLEYLGNQEGIGYIDNECIDEFYGHSYSCPACKHSIIGKQNYCENCGKRLNDKGD